MTNVPPEFDGLAFQFVVDSTSEPTVAMRLRVPEGIDPARTVAFLLLQLARIVADEQAVLAAHVGTTYEAVYQAITDLDREKAARAGSVVLGPEMTQ